ncbi:MAG: twin-arginine translocase TatA/TatE family subunit [Actinomycetota bacterium]
MFNIQGSELVFLLLIALLVLGPEKLPDAIRKFTRTYSEFKKVASGFQGELRQVLDEPMRELRGTADALRQAASFDPEAPAAETAPEPTDESARPTPMVSEIAPRSGPADTGEAALNFGNPAAFRARTAKSAEAAIGTAAEDPSE